MSGNHEQEFLLLYHYMFGTTDGSKIRIKTAGDAKDNSDASKGNNNSDTSGAKKSRVKSGSDSNSSGNQSWKSRTNPQGGGN
ncbi:hypothetical protein [Microcoleus sp. F4-D5]|uniref:hypothetical protein n=1 Tax=Microcoleus sp. F4-D5 TaxID=2818760 RepID=UPI002FD50EA1